MIGQIRVEFIFAVVIFGLIILFIASQINTLLTISLTTSKSDDLRAKAISVITALVEDKGDPADWDQPQEIPVDVMLVIDISGSMDGQIAPWGLNCRLPCDDFQDPDDPNYCIGCGTETCPTCNDCDSDGHWADQNETPCAINDAKNASKVFVDQLNSLMDKSGVVAFNQTAYLYRGLIDDKSSVKSSIDTIYANQGAGTGIGEGITAATNELTTPNGRDGVDDVQILLTDGRNNVGRPPLEAAQEAADNNIKIYTIGLGEPGHFDESLLNDIADMTGGKYYHAPNSTELEEIYKEIAFIIKIDPRRLGLVDQKPYQLSMSKITILEIDCTLLDYFDLKGYRLRIYQEEQQFLFCGYESLVPPTTIITKDVFIDGTPGRISLELWL